MIFDIVLNMLHFKSMVAIWIWRVLSLINGILLIQLCWRDEWSVALVEIPFNLGTLIHTLKIRSMFNAEDRSTYARLIIHVRANIALWTELVEM